MRRPSPSRLPPRRPGDKLHEITFAKSGRTVACDEGTTILAAARSAGLRLPSSCTRGLCGTCKTRKVSGEVEMNHQGGIRQREIDAGLILLCETVLDVGAEQPDRVVAAALLVEKEQPLDGPVDAAEQHQHAVDALELGPLAARPGRPPRPSA